MPKNANEPDFTSLPLTDVLEKSNEMFIQWTVFPDEERARRLHRLTANNRAALGKFNLAMTQRSHLSEKQWRYYASLLWQVTAPDEGLDAKVRAYATNGTATPLPILSSLLAFLNRGEQKVLFYAKGVYVLCKYTGVEYTKYPHSYHVTYNMASPRMVKDYLGRIESTGQLVIAGAVKGLPAKGQLIEALQSIDADPLAAAVAYARATNRCGFCTRELTDEPSVQAGYGPICAEKYGLPWGDATDEVSAYGRQPIIPVDPNSEF